MKSCKGIGNKSYFGKQLKVNRPILATETMHRAVFGSLRSRVDTHAQTKVGFKATRPTEEYLSEPAGEKLPLD